MKYDCSLRRPICSWAVVGDDRGGFAGDVDKLLNTFHCHHFVLKVARQPHRPEQGLIQRKAIRQSQPHKFCIFAEYIFLLSKLDNVTISNVSSTQASNQATNKPIIGSTWMDNECKIMRFRRRMETRCMGRSRGNRRLRATSYQLRLLSRVNPISIQLLDVAK